MKCPDPEQLAAYHAELLNAVERAQVSRHLAGCLHCQREIAALDRTVHLLETAPAPAMPENLWAGVANRLPAAPRRTWWGQWWWKTAASCGLAASLLIGFAVMRPHSPLPSASPHAASYVATHELLSAQDPLADRAGLGAMLIAQGSTHE